MNSFARTALLVCVVVAPPGVGEAAGGALTAPRAIVASSVNDKVCVVPRAAAEFAPSDRQAFLWVELRGVRAGDQIQIDWVDPAGAVTLAAPYHDLPAAAELCVISQLPIAGFGPARQPGGWTVNVRVGDRLLRSQKFTIAPEPANGEPRIASLERQDAGKEIEFTVLGSGFQEGATMHVAEYSRTGGGWKYIALLRPRALDSGRMSARTPALPPGDYVMLVRNPDGRSSLAEPFLISTGRAYRLPTAAGEPWVVTQGPYGTFSHWGNSLHAYDIAPRGGRCVVAMRAGTVYTFDRGMRQNHRSRSFGNYITIDHGDGEYSHYAHLASGTFLVRNGERVEQGQALAIAGNSGYTLGEGGGVHVHVHITRAPAASATSVPFRFEELGEGWRPGRYTPVVSHTGTPGACGLAAPRGAPGAFSSSSVASSRSAPPATVLPGTVQATQWWNEFVWVPKDALALETSLVWNEDGSALDLHLMAPDGHHYGWYGDTDGYSGRGVNPQSFRLSRPRSGWWRISVQAARGGPMPVPFEVRTSAQKTPVAAGRAGGFGGR